MDVLRLGLASRPSCKKMSICRTLLREREPTPGLEPGTPSLRVNASVSRRVASSRQSACYWAGSGTEDATTDNRSRRAELPMSCPRGPGPRATSASCRGGRRPTLGPHHPAGRSDPPAGGTPQRSTAGPRSGSSSAMKGESCSRKASSRGRSVTARSPGRGDRKRESVNRCASSGCGRECAARLPSSFTRRSRISSSSASSTTLIGSPVCSTTSVSDLNPSRTAAELCSGIASNHAGVSRPGVCGGQLRSGRGDSGPRSGNSRDKPACVSPRPDPTNVDGCRAASLRR
jgi:hypothetical protein